MFFPYERNRLHGQMACLQYQSRQPQPGKNTVKTFLAGLLKNESVVTAVEYGLIAALIWGAVTVGVRIIGSDRSDSFCLSHAICQ